NPTFSFRPRSCATLRLCGGAMGPPGESMVRSVPLGSAWHAEHVNGPSVGWGWEMLRAVWALPTPVGGAEAVGGELSRLRLGFGGKRMVAMKSVSCWSCCVVG